MENAFLEEAQLPDNPLNQYMERLGLTSTDLVQASGKQLTYKVIRKARKGKEISAKAQDKIIEALQRAKPDETIRREELFGPVKDK